MKKFDDNSRAKILFTNNTADAEVSVSRKKRKRGLAGRMKLAENEGMLFVYPESSKHGIWAKGMKFPINVIWIDGNQISAIKTLNPHLKDIDWCRPDTVSEFVLEVNSGFCEKNNIKIGDPVEIILDEDAVQKNRNK